MTHLTDLELVDAAESRLAAERQRHLGACADCRAHVRDLQDTLASVAGVDVPEPSPLFWQHLSTRVMSEIADDSAVPGARLWSGWRPRIWVTAAAALVLIAAVTLVTVQRTSEPAQPLAPPAVDVNADVPFDLDDGLNALNADEGWAVVRSVADGANWGADEAHEAGVAPAPGWANTAAWSLNAAELTELARLLEDELKRDKGV
jgi:hypothetical protein